MSDDFDIVVRLLLNEANARSEAERVASTFDSIQNSVDASNKSLKNQTDLLKKWKDQLSDLKQQLKVVRQGTTEYEQIQKKIALTTESIRFQSKVVRDATDAHNALTRTLEKQETQEIKTAKAIRSRANVMQKELADLKEKAGFIDKAAQPLFVAGVAGFTAIALSANNYIKSTKEVNELTKDWAKSSESISESQLKIGKISAQAILPLYEKLAVIISKAADFADKNPQIVKAALGASIVAAGLGGIGILVSKGITLYADVKMIAVGDIQLLAAKIMADAAQKQLEAAAGSKITGGLTTAGKVEGGAALAGGTAGGGIVATVAGATSAAIAFIGLNIAMVKVIDKGQELTQKLTGSAIAAHILGDTVRTAISSIPGLGLIKSLYDLRTATAITTAANTAGAQSQNNLARQTTTSLFSVSALAGRIGIVKTVSDAAAGALSKLPNILVSIVSSVSSLLGRIIAPAGNKKPPTHDYTGYAYSQIYAMAQDGKRQFVLSGDATRMAERTLGGQLNQQRVLQAINGGNRNVTVNARGRFSGEYTNSMKRAVNKDVEDTILQTLDKVFR